MLTLLAALILGVIQGVLEWLPISSEGNLALLMVSVLGTEPAEALSLSIYLHLGSGLAATIYFRSDVVKILSLNSESARGLFRFLLISTILTGAIGLPIYLYARRIDAGVVLVGLTGIALIATGVAQRLTKRFGTRGSENMNFWDSILLGIVQGFSIIPGVSRSGVTTSALLYRGFTGEEALRISFLMSIPATFAASLGLVVIEGAPPMEYNFLVAVGTAFLTSLLFVDVMLKLARKIRFWALCVTLGAIVMMSLVPYVI